MSNKKTFSTAHEGVENLGSQALYGIDTHRPDFIVGRVMTILESIGLPEKQEKALKDIVKQEIYDILDGHVYIEAGLSEVIQRYENYRVSSPPYVDGSRIFTLEIEE